MSQANGDIDGAGWEDLPAALEKNGAVSKLSKLMADDGQLNVSIVAL